MNTELPALLEKYGFTDIRNIINNAKKINTSPKNTFDVDDLNIEVINLINHVYDLDFKLFGYDKLNC